MCGREWRRSVLWGGSCDSARARAENRGFGAIFVTATLAFREPGDENCRSKSVKYLDSILALIGLSEGVFAPIWRAKTGEIAG
jgi:hypothetical protein